MSTVVLHRPSGRLPLLGRLRVIRALRRGQDVALTVVDGRTRTTIGDPR